ncbi:Ribosome maturation factor RimP [Paraliobacillus sp. PM-2]|uniref:ribosome maturation factor RimP n=1 Tax=Paraliobacillus sp. PM-2 TaxID=1462524 RepID=UPI00061C366F|nr:ribosome maturation factor RimP [Paraliobacillus sp. PM-2]CQR47660.1 Ribosome maturation factor RimP [Paraliobacillus sp. PM-2]
MGLKVTEKTREIVEPILDKMNLELVDIEFEKEGKNWFLRVFIDKSDGVDIEECGIVSEQLSEQLDQEDPVSVPYYLEVSSPGAERPLKKEQDFKDNIGKTIFISLYEPYEGAKTFEGELIGYDGTFVTIEIKVKTRKKQVQIPYKKIAKARLAVTFN